MAEGESAKSLVCYMAVVDSNLGSSLACGCPPAQLVQISSPKSGFEKLPGSQPI